MNIMDFLETGLLILPLILYIVGEGIKRTDKIKDNYIPLLLGVAGCLLSGLFLWPTGLQPTEYIFKTVTQGVLSAGLSVYANQIYKQTFMNNKEPETEED